MILTYDFDENSRDFDYEVEDLNYKLAEIIADEINEFRELEAVKRGTPFVKISDMDVYDALDWVDAFENIDPNDYVDKLKDMCEDEAYECWKESDYDPYDVD